MTGCRTRVLSMIVAMSFAAGVPLAQESTSDDAPAPAQAATKATAPKAEFKPPPGFRTKKRGGKVMYCIKDSSVGTRFKSEKCYDEEGVRDYVLAREENMRDFDQARSTCSACSSN